MRAARLSSFSQLDHFTIFNIAAIDREAHDGAHILPALFTGSPRIHVQAF